VLDGVPATVDNLIITELNYEPHDPTPAELAVDEDFLGRDFEFIELQNTSASIVDLTGVEFGLGVVFAFSAGNVTELGPGERVVVVRDTTAFEVRYGSGVNVAGFYTGGLNNGGEPIELLDASAASIFTMVYDNSGDWPGRAEGKGASLELIDPAAVPAVEPQRADYLNDGNHWRSSIAYGGTPGAGPELPPGIVVNEVLSFPLLPDVDTIELYNPTGEPIDVGGWYLSDSSSEYRKFQIPRDVPAETTIQPDGYLVFDASDFNPTPATPGPNDFGLDADGDDVWLFETDASDNLVRLADHADFGSAQAGKPFGLWPNGTGSLMLLSSPTPDGPNSLPLSSQIVINELHVRPDVKTSPLEFVELFNAGDTEMDLSGWYFTDGIEYTFPADTTLAAGGYVVIAENEAAAEAAFSIDAIGSFTGQLANDGERIVLRDALGLKRDEVEYGLGFPWPTTGDAPGYSMELINPALDNNEPGSWRASSGSAATQETLINEGEVWSYFKGFSEPSSPTSAWREFGFNDASWQSGPLAIGYSSNTTEQGFIETTLSDMKGNYTTVYLRKKFTVADPAAVGALELLAQYDDGINIWINGVNVPGLNVDGPELAYDDTSRNAIDNIEFVPTLIPSASSYNLAAGADANVIAVQLLNASKDNSSDAFFDVVLRTSSGGSAGVTPGMANSVLATNAPPYMDAVGHAPVQPVSGQDVVVTMAVADSDGVAQVTLAYQTVEPGDYINKSDSRYENPAYWTTVAMADDGTGGDAVGGDGVYSATLLGTVQQNRRLIRYRVTAEDTLGASATAPYADDPQPNFAYYVYDGVPSWTGSDRPGAISAVEYDSELLTSLPVYTLITDRVDRLTAMSVPYRSGEADEEIPVDSQDYYGGSDYKWEGTLVYDGVVYDHVRYRARGGVWRYSMGKNMWKFDFNRGHYFQARDDYGNPYDFKWDKLNFSALIQQGNFGQRGEQGLFEWAGFKLHNLAGNAASNSNYLHFRLVDDDDEGGPDQFSSDFQGLYLAIEQPDGRLLDEHGLPDGNFYKMEGGTGTLNNQGPTQPTNKSDLNDFMNIYKNSQDSAAWWENNLDLEDYYSFRMISMAIHDYDMHSGKNYFYYHNPVTDKWSVHNWDLDLCWTTTYGGGGGTGPLNGYVLDVNQYPQFVRDYNNRVRELRDLLFNSEQTGMLLDENASFIYQPGELSFAAADAAMWDYNPILVSSYVNSSKAAHGRYYGNAVNPPGDFAGMIQREKNYVQSRQSYNDPKVSYDEGQQPNTPSVTYIGEGGHPVDGLVFRSSAFGGGSGSFAAMEWRIAAVTDPNAAGYDPYDRTTPRKYEITADWQSGEITTFDNTITVPGYGLEEGETYRVRVRMKDSVGRWSHWSDHEQFEASAATGEVAPGLRITEINYHPYNPTVAELAVEGSLHPDDFEFIELQNISAEELDLSAMAFIEGIRYQFPYGDTLAPGEYLLLAANPTALAMRYDGISVGDVDGIYERTLDDGGERLLMVDGYGRTVFDFAYNDGDNWPGRPDGKGATLEPIDPAALPGDNIARTATMQDGNNWQRSVVYGGTPGTPPVAELGVVINEVLSHTDWPEVDSIELHNTTGADVDLTGWYLSDSGNRYEKYRIPPADGDPTIILAGGYMVFDESHFNPTPLAPGPDDFALDAAHGDDVWLMKATAAGDLTHFADHVDLAVQGNAESWGRWPNGTGELYPMAELTLGAANTGPRVGPVLLSEVHYNPGTMAGADDLEFVEIYNPGPMAVDLAHWHIDRGIEYQFETGTTLDAGAVAVIVSFDPIAEPGKLGNFQTAYGMLPSVDVYGPYSGQLSDTASLAAGGTGEKVQLLRPDEPPLGEPGYYPPMLEDEVIYAADGDWPGQAAGNGDSLHRLAIDAWGNEATSWSAAAPSPGHVSLGSQPAQVVGRHVFYNESFFDGDDTAANVGDDNAIASDKTALQAGQVATAANYTSYSRGINGIMIDVANLPEGATPVVDDFEFRVGNDDTPATWDLGPVPDFVTVRAVDGFDRITLIWSDGQIRNEWLEVTVLPTTDCPLPTADVFYFGNAVAETGNSPADARVTTADLLLARNNPRDFTAPATVEFPYDFDRDSEVNATDVLLARNNQTSFLDVLKLIDVSGSAEQAQESPLAELAWLSELSQAAAQQRPAEKDAATDAVDKLLATFI